MSRDSENKLNKKIGILTFHRANNYGAVLQNYALVRAVKKIDSTFQVNTIDYRCLYLEEPYSKNPFDIKTDNFLKNVWYKMRKRVNQSRYKRLVRSFEEFREQYLDLTKSYSYEALLINETRFNTYITGSDQIWNDKITNADGVYSLNFVNKARRLSYAASAGSVHYIGRDTLKNIGKIDAISVREKDLQKFLEQSLGRSVELVVDPVFLLSKDEWNSILNKNRILKHKYIFTYSVSEKTEDVIKVAKILASERKLKIVHLDHSMKYGVNGRLMYGASPLEFVQLIRDAEFVVASSFHAIAFSIIFRKQFIVIPTKKTASRMKHLLEITELGDNMFNSYQEFLDERTKVTIKEARHLSKYVDNSIKFLQSQL